MAATSARAFMLSRVTDLSRKNLILHQPPPSSSSSPRHRLLPHHFQNRSVSSSVVISCLTGGVSSDDSYVFTRRSKLNRGFAVIANLLNRIQPLDTSVISKGLSESAKDSMKQTISSMLGLLPSDQFTVSVSISEQPLNRLLISSIITGYTLWNAEYRVSLTRNFDIPIDPKKEQEEESSKDNVGFGLEEGVGEDSRNCVEELERMSPKVFGELSPEALSYIQHLQSELSTVKEELDLQKKKALQIECERGNKNDLLEYLRSLDPEMVTELSQLSSPEVEEIVSQLVQNVLQKIFKEETTSNFIQDSVVRNTESGDGTGRKVDTSRDYLAKLLFWCMLLGHHLRGLENRLHLSCVVGLL